MANEIHNVLVCGNVLEAGKRILREFANVTELPEPINRSDVIDLLPTMDAILHKKGVFDSEMINAQTRLKLVARHGVGLDELDMATLSKLGIPVSITPTANFRAVAEATFGMALGLMRHLTTANMTLKMDRKWAREPFMGREIHKSNVGIVGFGRIGHQVGKFFEAFGANVLIYDPFTQETSGSGFRVVGFEELLSESDIVTLHCPLTDETRHMIDSSSFSCMRQNAIIVNTARGDLIDPKALVIAVQKGQISGAALDVFSNEPADLTDDIFKENRILTTPHIAAMTKEAQTASAVMAANEIRRVLVEQLHPEHLV